MLGNRFLPYLKPSPRRPMIRLQGYLEALDTRTHGLIDRAVKPLDLSYGTRIVLAILEEAEITQFLYSRDPLRLIKDLLPSLEQRLDSRLYKNNERPLFLSVRTPCFEMIMAARHPNPSSILPVDKPYADAAWKTIKPFRVYDLGPCDFSQHFFNGYLKYPKRGPTHAFYTLDITLLIMKAIAYLKADTTTNDIPTKLRNFAIKDIVVPSLLIDTQILWLRNAYRQQLIQSSPLETYTATMWDGISFDSLGSDFRNAMIDVAYLRDILKGQTTSPQTVLSSLLVTHRKESIASVFCELYTTTPLPDSQDYTWVVGLRNLAWWEFILVITSYLNEIPEIQSFHRIVARDIRLLLMTKPWNEVRASVAYTSMTYQRIEGLVRYLT